MLSQLLNKTVPCKINKKITISESCSMIIVDEKKVTDSVKIRTWSFETEQ